MAKSSRASRIKKNNQALKKKVFGPVEQARNERLSAKLLELAQKPKEKDEQLMDVEQDVNEKEEKEETAQPDIDMDATATTKPPRSKREVKRLQAARAERQEKNSRKKPRNQVKFPTPARRTRQSKR